MTFIQVWDFIQTTGVLGGSFLFIYALYSKKLRFGWDYDRIEAKNERLEKEKEALLMTALSNAGIANVLLQSAETRKAVE